MKNNEISKSLIILPEITFKSIANKIIKKDKEKGNYKDKDKDNDSNFSKTNKSKTNKGGWKNLYKSSSNDTGTGNNLLDQDINVHKKIVEIKKNIRENQNYNLILNSIDKNFFSNSCINLIQTSNTIVKEKLKGDKSKIFNKDSVSKFISDNKEIYIKNNIIKLMNSEIVSLKSKESKVSSVLKDAEVKLDYHLQDFNRFIELEKEQLRNNEKKLSEVINQNKKLFDHKRLLVQNNRQVLEDIDRIIKLSINLMSYASFVCYALKIKSPSDFISLNFRPSNFEFIGNEYENEMEKFIQIILSNFKNVVFEIPSDPNQMIFKLNDIESKIIKVIEKNEEINRETLREEKEAELELKYLDDKLNEVMLEKKKIMEEYNKEEKFNHHSLKKTDDDSFYVHNNYARYFKEMSQLIEDDTKKKKGTKKNDDTIKNIIDGLKVFETRIINRISFLQNFELIRPEEFLFFTNKRREFNKEKKVKDQQKKKQEMDLYKQQKARDRSKRIVIKARKVAKHFNLNHGNEVRCIVKSDDKDNDEASLIYYNNEDS
jgi:hypothetical protein